MKYARIRLDQIEPDPEQPRKRVASLDSMTESLKEHGIIQPIKIYAVSKNRYRILVGERRYAAAKAAGWTSIDAIVTDPPGDLKRSLVQLLENRERQDLHPVEEARALEQILEKNNLTQEQLAKKLGVAKSNISQTLSILNLDQRILSRVQTCEHASKSILIELVKLETYGEQLALVEKMEKGVLTVQETRSRGEYNKRMVSKTYENQPRDLKVILRYKSGAPYKGEKDALRAAIEFLAGSVKGIPSKSNS